MILFVEAWVAKGRVRRRKVWRSNQELGVAMPRLVQGLAASVTGHRGSPSLRYLVRCYHGWYSARTTGFQTADENTVTMV